MSHPNLSETLKAGQLLMIETQTEILIGNLKLIGLDGQIIEIENVRDFKTNYAYTSSQILPLPQIRTIKILQEDDEDDEDERQEDSTTETKPIFNSIDSTSTPTSPSSSASSTKSLLPEKSQRCVQSVRPEQISNVANSTPPIKTVYGRQSCAINLSNRELLHIQEQLESVIYIYQTDQKYHKALADIKMQSVISLVLEPVAFGRHNQTSLIAVGTNRSVYIFDILNLGKILRELKDILEAKRPRKALHDGRQVLDNLLHRQHVELGGVFDTFVAHCLLTGGNKPLSLIETVQLYYDISEMYFSDQALEHVTAQTNNVFINRPLHNSTLQHLAKKTVFQYKLYEHLLHEQMLGNFYQQCEQFTHTFSSNPDSVEVVMQMKPKNRQGFEHIKMHDEWNEFLDKNLK